MSDLDQTTLLRVYHDERDRYGRLASAFQATLVNLLTAVGLQYLTVAARVKEVASFLEKVSRKGYTSPLEQTEDLCGLRVICYYRSDVERVCELIRSEFQVDESEDKSTLLLFNQFGYRSVHFILRVPEAWADTGVFRGLGGLKAEVQVRTVLEHAWAEIEHSLAYKTSEQVTPAFRRKLSTLSALLEEADGQLESLRTHSTRRRLNLLREAKGRGTFRTDDSMDLDALVALLSFYFPDRRCDRDEAGFLLERIQERGFSTGDLVSAIESTPAAVLDHLEVELGEINEQMGPWTSAETLCMVLVLTERLPDAGTGSALASHDMRRGLTIRLWRTRMQTGDWQVDEPWWV